MTPPVRPEPAAITAGEALEECLRRGCRSTAIAILQKSVEMDRACAALPAGWQTSLEELLAICLEHSHAARGGSPLSTLDYVEALANTDSIADTLRQSSEPVCTRLLSALTA